MSITPAQSLCYCLQHLTIEQLDILMKENLKILTKERKKEIKRFCGESNTTHIGAALIDALPIIEGDPPQKPSEMPENCSAITGFDSKDCPFIAIKVTIGGMDTTPTVVEVIRFNNHKIVIQEELTDDSETTYPSVCASVKISERPSAIRDLLEGKIIQSSEENTTAKIATHYLESYDQITRIFQIITYIHEREKLLSLFSIRDFEILSKVDLQSIHNKKVETVVEMWGQVFVDFCGASTLDSIPNAGNFIIPIDAHTHKFACLPSNLGKNSAINGIDQFGRQYIALRLNVFENEDDSTPIHTVVEIIYKKTLGENTLPPIFLYQFSGTIRENNKKEHRSYFYCALDLDSKMKRIIFPGEKLEDLTPARKSFLGKLLNGEKVEAFSKQKFYWVQRA
ncbi:MAG: hypothetical protein KR126chlam1_00722 [Chlamydiae bacterium]|nr:hypothetical protein [Chlamydiota bacterium]